MRLTHLLLPLPLLALLVAAGGCEGSVGSPAPAKKVVSDGDDDVGPPDTENEEPPTGLVDFDSSYDNLIDGYVLARLDRLGIEPHWASEIELIRRLSLDLSGVAPGEEEYTALEGATPEAMADYFLDRPGYQMVSQVIYADLLSFSNDEMYSTIGQIQELDGLVAELHAGDLAYDEFARQVIMHPAYLSRFTSAADRATASLTIFVGYEPVTQYDFEFGNMFRGYELTDEDNRLFEWTGECDDAETPETETCDAEIWGMSGANPTDAGEMMTSLEVFAEHGAAVVWKRFMVSEVEASLPELAVALGHFYEESGFNLRTLTKEIVTSAAYRQSFTYREGETSAE